MSSELSKENKDLLNLLFAGKNMPLFTTDAIALDVVNLNVLNAEVVTVDNVWTVLTLLSVLTHNSGKSMLYRTAVTSIQPDEYSGESVLNEVRKLFLTSRHCRQRTLDTLCGNITRTVKACESGGN